MNTMSAMGMIRCGECKRITSIDRYQCHWCFSDLHHPKLLINMAEFSINQVRIIQRSLRSYHHRLKEAVEVVDNWNLQDNDSKVIKDHYTKEMDEAYGLLQSFGEYEQMLVKS